MLQIKGRGITEYEQLEQRRDKDHQPALLVLQKGQKFLDHEGNYPSSHISLPYSSLLCDFSLLSPRNTTDMPSSASAFGRMTDQIFPARKTV